MSYCDRCPLKRHRRPCPAQWDGCADACDLLDVGDFRHRLIAARDPAEFRTEVAATFEVQQTPAQRDCELVVAHYREQLAWLADAPCPATVYTKGGAPIVGVPAVRLPNVGREAHTHLFHIVNRYDSLAEWTAFVQGDPFPHAPDLLARLTLRPDRPLSLTRYYLPETSPPAVAALDLVESFGGFESRYGDTRTFGGQSFPRGREAWFARAWHAVFDCPQPSPWYFGFGALWMVPRASILARPRAFWSRLLEVISHTPAGTARQPWSDWQAHPLNAWAFEALWFYLFADPGRYPARAAVAAPTGGTNQSAEGRDAMRRAALARSCPHRGCKTGCQSAECLIGQGDRRDGREATFRHCTLSCLRNPLSTEAPQ